MKVAYNNSLRRFTDLPWHNIASEMFVNLNIKSFGEMFQCFVYGFCSKIMISGNMMLIGIYNSPYIIYSKLWVWWRTLLFATQNLSSDLYNLQLYKLYFKIKREVVPQYLTTSIPILTHSYNTRRTTDQQYRTHHAFADRTACML